MPVLMNNSLVVFFLVSVFLVSCGGTNPPVTPPAETLPSEAVVLKYNSAVHRLEWSANPDFQFAVENAFSSESGGINFSVVSQPTNNFYSLSDADSGLYRVRVCLMDGTACSDQVSNQVLVERNKLLFVTPSTVFWQSIDGFSQYRIEVASQVGGTFKLLVDTSYTTVALPEILPSALRLYGCSTLCNANSRLIDEITLDVTTNIPASWQQEEYTFDSQVPDSTGSVLRTNDRFDQPQSALLFADGGRFSTVSTPSDNFSIALWFNSSVSSGTIVERRANDDNYWSIELRQRELFLRLKNVEGSEDQQLFLGEIDISKNNWHHLFFQYNSVADATVRLGVDGDISVLTLDAGQNTRFSSAAGELRFGATTADEGEHFEGKLDDISILNRAIFGTAAISEDEAYDYLNTLLLDSYQGNYYPIAIPPSLSITAEEMSVAITLTGTDQNGDSNSLVFAVATQPSNGSVSIEGDLATYIPNVNFFGNDSFAFTVSDSENAQSAPAVVEVIITGTNDVPIVSDTQVVVTQNVIKSFSVDAIEVDGDSLSFAVVIAPLKGALAVDNNIAGLFHYLSTADNIGSDTATISISDGKTTVEAKILITIITTELPTADDKSVETQEDTAVTITLSGNDPDGDNNAITYQIVSQPSNGNITLSEDRVVYTPASHFFGEDSFTYQAIDEKGAFSESALVSINIISVNDAPIAFAVSSTTSEDTMAVIMLEASDIEDASSLLTYMIATGPGAGSVEIIGDQAIYTPDVNYNGNDSFSFRALDSAGLASAVAVATIVIAAVNDAPVANTDTRSAKEDTAEVITLIASDVDDNNSLTYVITTPPGNGSAEISGNQVTYIANTDYNGDDSFNFQVTDNGGLTSNIATITIVVEAVNDAPIAEASSETTDEDTAVVILLNASDVEDDSSVLTYAITKQPSNGSVVISDNKATYTPSANYNGAASFEFKVTDSGNLDSAVAQVSIAVVPVNDAPVATAVSSSTDEDTAVVITLIASDIDDNDPLTYTINTQPSNGSVELSGQQATYTPDTNYNGSDSFEFQVTDDDGLTSTVAVVTIIVNSVNDAPIANTVSGTTNEDNSVVITLTASDIDDDLSLLTYTIATQPSNGSVEISANQATYTPNANYNGDDSFSFQAIDSEGATSAAALVTIAITAVNDAPVASAVSDSTEEDTAVVVTLIASDIEDTDSLVYFVSISPQNGSVTINGNKATYTPNSNYNGDDSFNYRAIDSGNVNSEPALVNISVAAVNDAPVAIAGSSTTSEDTAITIALAASDIEDAVNLLTYALATQPSNGSVQINANQVTYTPELDYYGSDSFEFTATDSDGLTSTVAIVTIAITAVNDAPIVSDISSVVIEDIARVITLIASDVDGDTLLYFIVSQPSKGTLVLTDNKVTYTPNSNYNGDDSFMYRVLDDKNTYSEVAKVSINVTAVNDAPVINNTSVTITINKARTFTLDISDVDGDTLTISIASTPTQGSIVLLANNQLEYTPNANYIGSDTMTVIFTDGVISVSAEIQITVIDSDPPTADDKTASVNEDESVTITVTADDPDGDNSGLTYGIVSQPINGSVTLSGNSVIYTPNANFSGTDSFTYLATDENKVNSEPATVDVTVIEINDDPVASSGSGTTNEDNAVVIVLVASDVEDVSGSLTYTVTIAPSNGTVVVTGAMATYTPTADYNGVDSFSFQVTDSDGLTSTVAVVTITITAVNDAPVATAGSASTSEDTAVDIGLIASDVEDDSSLLTYTVTAAPSNGTVVVNGATATYTPNTDYNGVDSFSFQVADSEGLISTEVAVAITITAVNDVPVANASSVTTIEDTAVDIELIASDVEDVSGSLTYTITSEPSNGTVVVNGTTATYTPNSDYNGVDSFSFEATDSEGATSTVAVVTITITAVNDATSRQCS